MISWLTSVHSSTVEIQEYDGPLHVICGNDVRFVSYEDQIFVQPRQGADIILRVKPHHSTQPAIRAKNENDEIVSEVWFRDGWIHRDGSPAYVEYENLKTKKEAWYRYGKRHRVDGPAETVYCLGDEMPLEQKFFQNNVLHRTDGPAVIINGQKTFAKWYINGQEVPDFEELVGLTEDVYVKQFEAFRLKHADAKNGELGSIMRYTAPNDKLRQIGEMMRSMM